MELCYKPNLEGKVAVVTGGAGVLCKEFAKAMAACGAKVAILGRTLSKAEAVAEEINAAGGVAIAVSVDVTNAESVNKAHEEVLARLGKCDILINGAGGNNPRATTDKEYFEAGDLDEETKTFFDMSAEDVEYVFNPAKCLQFGWATGVLAATSLFDYAQPADEKQVWDIYAGNARVQR